MKRAQRAWPTIFIASVAVAAALAASAAPGQREKTQAQEESSCCVANPRHAGICKVQLGPDETCQDVLAYLNNANTVGRTYCGNTTVRGGWKQVACQE